MGTPVQGVDLQGHIQAWGSLSFPEATNKRSSKGPFTLGPGGVKRISDFVVGTKGKQVLLWMDKILFAPL